MPQTRCGIGHDKSERERERERALLGAAVERTRGSSYSAETIPLCTFLLRATKSFRVSVGSACIIHTLSFHFSLHFDDRVSNLSHCQGDIGGMVIMDASGTPVLYVFILFIQISLSLSPFISSAGVLHTKQRDWVREGGGDIERVERGEEETGRQELRGLELGDAKK